MDRIKGFSKKIESLSSAQLKTVVQFLYDHSEYEVKASAVRIVEKMFRANREDNMQEAEAEQLNKEITRRLEEWQSIEEGE